MAIMAYTDGQGTCEVITGPFTTLTWRISIAIPALGSFSSFDLLVHLWGLCSWMWLKLCFFVALVSQRTKFLSFSCFNSKAVCTIMETWRSSTNGWVHPPFQLELMGCIISLSRCRVAKGWISEMLFFFCFQSANLVQQCDFNQKHREIIGFYLLL